MTIAKQASGRLLALITKGDGVLASPRTTRSGAIGAPTLDRRTYAAWRNQAIVALSQVFGDAHHYPTSFASETKRPGYKSSTEAGLGILCAASEDVEHGHLETIQQMVAAGVFSDFIEQAEHLLRNGYHIPVASLTGAVLENGLRTLAEKNGIPTNRHDGLPDLNKKLCDKGVYSEARRSRVAFWVTVRNHADHGHFDEVTKDDVVEMVKGIRTLLADYGMPT